MKKILFFTFNLIMLFTNAKCNSSKNLLPTGSWINIKVPEFYQNSLEKDCILNHFNNDKYSPLFLSFENNQVKIIHKIEQTIFTYNVKSFTTDSMLIYRGNKKYRLRFMNDTLVMDYNQRTIYFCKVSNYYSSDVFGEYIKSSIFSNNSKYLVTYFQQNEGYLNTVLNIRNFKETLKGFFKSEFVDFVSLGSFKYKESCLPIIALYYESNEKKPPTILGLLIQKNDVKFVDELGNIVLIIEAK